MKNYAIVSVFILSFLNIIGCNGKINSGNGTEGEQIICTASIEPALKIQVFDKESGLQVSCGAIAEISDNNYSEIIKNEASENCYDEVMLTGAYEREGTYKIRVSKEGYMDFHFENINVSSNVCHVNTIILQAYLEK